MKSIYVLLLTFISFTATSQIEITQQPEAEETIFRLADLDVKPDFEGGLMNFYKFVSTAYKLPNTKLNGKVFVSFVIEKDGTLSNFEILRDLGEGTGEEAIRVLKESPKWIPGKKDGVNVRCRYSLPITVRS